MLRKVMSSRAALRSPTVAEAARLLAAGRPAEAMPLLCTAAALAPDDAALQHDYGVAALECGALGEAITALSRAVALRPDWAEAHLRLGIAHERARHTDPAIDAYARALALKASLTEAGFRGGNALYAIGRTEQAAAMFRRAADAARKSALGRLCAAKAALIDEDDEEAARLLRQILAREPGHAAAAELLATVLADTGRFDEALGFYERAIANGPHLAGSYYELVRCRKLTAADRPLVRRMEAALADPRHPPAQRFRILLALGKAEDDLGDPARAMAWFDQADAVRRAISPFDTAAFEARVARIVAWFTPERVARLAAGGNPDPTPVLIMGLPRSGTTLLEQIVSNHPQAAGAGEVRFWNWRGRVWDRAGLAEPDAAYIEKTAAEYLAVLRRAGPDAARVTDKMTANLLWAGLVHVVFPRATLLYCRRNPLDTALSIHSTHFNPMLEFPTGGDALVAVVRAYNRLGEHWRRVLPPDRFVEVEYEELTAAPERVVPRVVAGIGLPWDEACLRPHENTRAVRTPSKWQSRQPIYRSSTERWRRYEPYLGPLAALR